MARDYRRIDLQFRSRLDGSSPTYSTSSNSLELANKHSGLANCGRHFHCVTEHPVISKILFDLGIMHLRFAKIVIGAAGIHDIIPRGCVWRSPQVLLKVLTKRRERSWGRVKKSGHHVVVLGRLFGLRRGS